jgi:transcription elongation GreA/GreB family factor
MAARKKATSSALASPPAGDASPVLAHKRAILEQLRDDEERALAAMEEAAEVARAAAAHEEMKPENDKDTRALEAGYLASGQSARAAELRRAVHQLGALTPRAFAKDEPADVLAFVDVVSTDDDKRTRYFIAPAGGGKKVPVGSAIVLVITPSSPLGDALIGKRAGSIVEVTLGGRLRELEVEAVA